MLVPVDTIHLQEPDTLFLGEFLWVEVELQPFRLYVPDLRLRRVVVYDSLGRPVQVIGRPGTEAPGTLYRAAQVLVHGNLVYVQQEYSRVSRFTKTGRFIDRLSGRSYGSMPAFVLWTRGILSCLLWR